MTINGAISCLGGHGEVRSKTKVVHGVTTVLLQDLPVWNYDGSSTGQAPGTDSEVLIVPRALYSDPFRREGNNVLVVCDTYAPSKTELPPAPLPTNSRYLAAKIFEADEASAPWFGLEQEYTLFQDGRPLGWPKCSARSFINSPLVLLGFPGPQGPYYCAAGADRAFGREVVEEHLDCSLYAGLTISGINSEVMPGQWEFQVGPCTGIESGDMMLASRYILHRVCEKHQVVASFEPKPIKGGDWNGSGCHTNFSTKAMREPNGLENAIYPAIEKLGKRHAQHIKAYGAGNERRLTGKHETAGIDKFSYGVANRGASVRIPNSTAFEGKGYFEDRRPAASMDPYVVTSMIFDSAILDGKYSFEFSNIHIEGVDLKDVKSTQHDVISQHSKPAPPKLDTDIKTLNLLEEENTPANKTAPPLSAPEPQAKEEEKNPERIAEKREPAVSEDADIKALDEAEKKADIPKPVQAANKSTRSSIFFKSKKKNNEDGEGSKRAGGCILF